MNSVLRDILGYRRNGYGLQKSASKAVPVFLDDYGDVDDNGHVHLSDDAAKVVRINQRVNGGLGLGLGLTNLALAAKAPYSKKLRAANAIVGLAGTGVGAKDLYDSFGSHEDVENYVSKGRARRKAMKKLFGGSDD